MMLVINKSQTNLFATRAINPSLANPFYLFELKSDFNPDCNYYFNATDQSYYSDAYRQFEILETGSTYSNVTGGTISLSATGQYSYSIYEASASTLFISATTGSVLASGIAVVMGADNNNINSIYL